MCASRSAGSTSHGFRHISWALQLGGLAAAVKSIARSFRPGVQLSASHADALSAMCQRVDRGLSTSPRGPPSFRDFPMILSYDTDAL